MITKVSLLQTTKCNLILALRNYKDLKLSYALYSAGKAVYDNLYSEEMRLSIIDEIAAYYNVTVQEIKIYLETSRVVFPCQIDEIIRLEKISRDNQEYK
jgi:hypothetical protein